MPHRFQPSNATPVQKNAPSNLSHREIETLLLIGPGTAEDASLPPDVLRFRSDLESVIRLIEETPRESCPAMMINQLQRGLPYRGFLAALCLANLRTLGMGHPLAMLHSAHQLTLDLPVAERLLPLFYALDSFKFHQIRQRAIPHLLPYTGSLPSPDEAETEFQAGMGSFDPDRAERAMVVMTRSLGAHRIAELLWRYGARDWSGIGHSAIWVASTLRTLETVGWQHAETALRVTVRSIMGSRDSVSAQPYEANLERVQASVQRLPPAWTQAGASPNLTRELLALIREAKTEEASRFALDHLLKGTIRSGAVWDAVYLSAGEMTLNIPWDGGCPLHANTSANALRYAYHVSADAGNRLLLLLQSVAWMCLYRKSVESVFLEGETEGPEDLSMLEGDGFGDGIDSTWEILSMVSTQKQEAARKMFAFAQMNPESDALRGAAFRLLPVKSTWDPHQIKFPVAMFENCDNIHPLWRPHLLAAAVVSFKGTDDPDTPLMYQVRQALHRL